MVVAVDALQIAYAPVPKTACTSVKQVLAGIDPAVSIPPDASTATWHAIYPTRRFRQKRWAPYAGYWRFCVIRDPLARMLSVYTNRVLDFGDLLNSRRLKTRQDYRDLPRDPDPDTFFQNLDRYRAASSSIRHHALPSYIFLGMDLRRYHRVYRTSELRDLAQDLSHRSAQPIEMPRGNASATRLHIDQLQPATRDALRRELAGEYGFLQQFYDNPFASTI